jgi:CO/xanthine dehydrogenase Mo-binding subunit
VNEAAHSASQWIGHPLRRLEDARLLTGQGRYTDDVQPDGAAHVAFLRSPHAHARITRMDVGAARALAAQALEAAAADIEYGGVAQGLGQALFEQTVYGESAQLITGSFMDYAMPRADDLPDMQTHFDETVPTTMNPLGAKGAGEAGCHGATPAIVNAVIDALGVKEIDMPLTPERVWRALNKDA